ncbi:MULTISPECIES: hypothetical protein [unclassified Pseudoclavibacter]|uniref:hypothetical protein n=1 Tax=unclassified Pseudoclavibacter TaxID=2615177 RepID=UPI001BA94FD8|nr:hypothetical protein [Pseudoclavibacter sp. Marseille-Q4354]MBS3180517.1 hypothetical protein [Pseudoclavibacter sp. Marseille-Q4354]
MALRSAICALCSVLCHEPRLRATPQPARWTLPVEWPKSPREKGHIAGSDGSQAAQKGYLTGSVRTEPGTAATSADRPGNTGNRNAVAAAAARQRGAAARQRGSAARRRGSAAARRGGAAARQRGAAARQRGSAARRRGSAAARRGGAAARQRGAAARQRGSAARRRGSAAARQRGSAAARQQ